MIHKNEVEKLAELSRIELSEEEKNNIQNDLGKIIDYVSSLKEIDTTPIAAKDGHVNIFRSDENPHDSGGYTDALLQSAPKMKDGYIAVKQVMVEKRNK